jgi:putative ABC transport system substrate-binding protein
VRRREFITLLGGAAVALPLVARAQQPIGRTGKMPRVGMLMPGPAAHSAATVDPFYRGLHELGFREEIDAAFEIVAQRRIPHLRSAPIRISTRDVASSWRWPPVTPCPLYFSSANTPWSAG